MRGTFIQSYDCEGRWGVADRLTPKLRTQIGGAQLGIAYSRLLDILDRHGTSGTFAFTGAFLCDAPMLKRQLPMLRLLHSRCPGYLDSFLDDAENEQLDGWIGAGCLTKVRTTRVVHEIASHGFSHIPWDWPGFDASTAALEMEAVRGIADLLNLTMSTFAFSRNVIMELATLTANGIDGYRNSIMWQSRTTRLMREFHLWEAAETHAASVRPVAIPGGQFMNVRFGGRKLIPAGVTIARWRRMIDSACNNGRVAHLWCHPENFLEAPDGLKVLDEILSFVDRRRGEGRLTVMTQAEYSAAILRDIGANK